MKTLRFTFAILLVAMLAMPAVAGTTGTAPATAPADGVQAPAATGTSNVSQEQIDLIKKREDAKKRRDEMLKMRETTIEQTGQGGPTSLDQQLQNK